MYLQYIYYLKSSTSWANKNLLWNPHRRDNCKIHKTHWGWSRSKLVWTRSFLARPIWQHTRTGQLHLLGDWSLRGFSQDCSDLRWQIWRWLTYQCPDLRFFVRNLQFCGPTQRLQESLTSFAPKIVWHFCCHCLTSILSNVICLRCLDVFCRPSDCGSWIAQVQSFGPIAAWHWWYGAGFVLVNFDLPIG